MILERLRSETAEAHQELEAEVQIEAVIGDRVRYAELLRRFHGYHAAMEQALVALPGWGETGYEPGGRLKSPWLAEDLQALGMSPKEVKGLPKCEALPEVESVAQGLGCAYVLEGSTLGGRHIARLFTQAGQAGREELPRRFFAGYGEETGARWKQFCASLEKYAAKHPKEADALVDAARETFATFRAWVSR